MTLAPRAALLLLALAVFGGAARDQEPPRTSEPPAAASVAGPYAKSFAYALVGVADLDAALELWTRGLGMELARRRAGPDPGLAAVWSLDPESITDQALLNGPGLIDGGIHLIEFAPAGPPVRAGGGPFDLAPRSLAVAVRNVAERCRELAAAGLGSCSPLAPTTKSDAARARLTVHDGLEVELVESPHGAGGVMYAVLVTSDNEREADALAQGLGLELLERRSASREHSGTAGGPTAEIAVDLGVLGGRESRFGRLKLVQYGAAPGRDLYPRAVPPARGFLGLTYVVPDLDPLLERGAGLELRYHGRRSSILGEGRMATMVTPAGLRVDIIEL